MRAFLAPLGPRVLQSLLIGGSHGYDVQRGADERATESSASSSLPRGVQLPAGGYQPFAHMLPLLVRARDAALARSAALGITGVEIEDNKFSISVHYRRVDAAYHPTVEAVVRDIAARMNGLEVRPGKMVWEIRPSVAWGKGEAAVHILSDVLGVVSTPPGGGPPCAPSTGVADAAAPPPLAPLVICIGDDITDEDAFRAVKGLAAQPGTPPRPAPVAVTILVAAPVEAEGEGVRHLAARAHMQRDTGVMPRPTSAEWYLRDPGEVRDFLAWVVGTLAEGRAEAVTAMNPADVHPLAQEPGQPTEEDGL